MLYILHGYYCNEDWIADKIVHIPEMLTNLAADNEAEKGQIVEVSEIKHKYQKTVGHSIGGGQIYRVLARHGWKKKMPRSKHPKNASEEAIKASKKLNHE